ncbi:sacsin N-terminal ATP-binding-like domain-containing protein [Nocardioides scoriae]|nr:DEAD/DEAH box helicase family protein [Nocardioides scoriae]
MTDWAGPTSGLSELVTAESNRCLAAYREQPIRVESDANIETTIFEGGYGRKQIFELVQNAADALQGTTGRIHVVLTYDVLYVANQGSPLTEDGVRSLLGSHQSGKRDESIGRFGLGFKSVVALSDRPQVFSRSGSFGFDREVTRERIRRVVPDAPRFPVLRLATPLDPEAEARQDRVLAELMDWASTVIRIPLDRDATGVKEDLADFPSEFMLFSPQARELVLENRADEIARRIGVAARGKDVYELTVGEERSEWVVVDRQFRPSKLALEDAGELARREAVKVSWAVPRSGRRRQEGQFWAFFPTDDRSTLAGIVNTTWKLSEDRRRLLEGRFNQEILTEVLPAMVAAAWHKVVDRATPQTSLDLLPGRGKELRSWADGVLNEPVFKALREIPSLPDTTGTLRRPRDLAMQPPDIADDVMALWRVGVGKLPGWIDPRCVSNTERRSKAERLMGPIPPIPRIERWIEAARGEGFTAEGSAQALAILAALAPGGARRDGDPLSARVVLLENGTWARPARGKIFIRSSPDDGNFQFIHPELAKMPVALAALALVGVQVLDRAGELRHVLARARDPRSVDWAKAWSLARQCTVEVARTILADELPAPVEHHVQVRTLTGQFRPLNETFLPGPVLAPGIGANAPFCLDSRFHEQERALISSLGAVDQPLLRQGGQAEMWLDRYHDQIKDHFVESCDGAKPQMDRLVVLDEGGLPWPLQSLDRLPDPAREAVTRRVLQLASTDAIQVRHATQTQYGRKKYRNPAIQRIREHGRLETSFGPLVPGFCLIASDDMPPDVLPTVELPTVVAEQLGVRTDPIDLSALAWSALHGVAVTWHDDPDRSARFYSWAVHFSEAPQRILAHVGSTVGVRPPREVAVVRNRDVLQSLREQQIPVVFVEDEGDAEALQASWGLAEGTRLLEQELVFSATGDPESVVFHFPAMKLWLSPEQQETRFQVCSEISIVSATPQGQRARAVDSALHEGTVLVTSPDPAAVLRGVSRSLGLDMGPADVRSVLDQVENEARRVLVTQLRRAPDDATRLSLLVDAEVLRRTLPRAALEAIELEQGVIEDPVELARLVLAVQGVTTLSHFRAVLDEKGLNPPQTWAGQRSTRNWVTELGFAPELAGFAGQPRPANFVVEGPTELGDLHDYQEICVENIRSMVQGGQPRRGLVSLPTGAGKTRVAVQALVEEIRDGELRGPIVWIAQSDELCEQAVETWSYIWRSVGPREPLAIGRLWGNNEVSEETSAIQLVVATPQKLKEKDAQPDYAWMTETSVVVVDEAHTSVSPMYTKVLEWLGRKARTRREDRPLIGLTATPFRNTNVEETRRLVNRYDGNRLDGKAFEDDEPYPVLQAKRILAQVEQRVIDGAQVRLSKLEQEEVERFGRLPRNVEARLGADIERNKTIVEDLMSLPDDWPALVFASSVENARALAAQLVHKGIPSVAIDASTPGPVRRWYIDEFKAGRIRVITNYNVLSQGFDAPRVRAVYVTRPTFSANLYQQMIGRGLRGPLNGGSERVLIVNVKDNIDQYGDKLAFTEFDYLWSETSNTD